VISNGRLVSAAKIPGVEVGTRAEPFPELERLLEAHLGRTARIDDGFTAQNAALFEDAVVIRVKEGTTLAAPIVVVHAAGGADSPLLSVPRILVVADPGSDATIVQAHVFAGGAAVLESSVTEVVVLSGARLEHVRLHQGTPESAAVARVSVRQGKDSSYASRVFTFGGALARLSLSVLLDGAGASAVLDGLYLADEGDVLDHHTIVDHASPHCTSRERYKGTLDRTALAVFDGTVIVRRGASKTEGHQENRNLLLSNDAIVHTKPHLRIDTDDVKCSHGATVGRLDPEQLFYLRSRGIDESVARSMLIFAFAQDMTEGVRSPELREALAARIAARLPGGEEARELT
jgi:Fe-S cluster assembly protein SufD